MRPKAAWEITKVDMENGVVEMETTMSLPDCQIRLLRSTLKPKWEKESDPGVYPSGAGGAPLRPQEVLTDIEGSILAECGMIGIGEEPWMDFLSQISDKLFEGIDIVGWDIVADSSDSSTQVREFVPITWSVK